MAFVATGLDQLVLENFESIRGKRIGLVTHAAAVDSQLRSSVELFSNAPLSLTAIFGPEHGLHGQAQDLIGVTSEESPSITQVHSLYGQDVTSLSPSTQSLEGLDMLVIDLQDIGTRFYTFQATMLYCLQVALPMGLEVLVLDRPNPIGGVRVEGPAVVGGYESFVGAYNISIRHGLTLGELAALYTNELRLGPGKMRVIPCKGWNRSEYFDSTNLPWVLPSPNMPTVETAFVYPGQCLFEGTNLSEGRGTTKPFEICGAPWINAERIAKTMNTLELPGVVFRPVWFRPTFQKHAGKDCGGVQLHITDRSSYEPIRTSLALLTQLRSFDPSRFAWRTEIYEFVENPIAIDLLFGSDRERIAIESGVDWREIAQEWQPEEIAFGNRRSAFLLY